MESGLGGGRQDHRFLVFTQLRDTLELLKTNFFGRVFPLVEYRSLHGKRTFFKWVGMC